MVSHTEAICDLLHNEMGMLQFSKDEIVHAFGMMRINSFGVDSITSGGK